VWTHGLPVFAVIISLFSFVCVDFRRQMTLFGRQANRIASFTESVNISRVLPEITTGKLAPPGEAYFGYQVA